MRNFDELAILITWYVGNHVLDASRHEIVHRQATCKKLFGFKTVQSNVPDEPWIWRNHGPVDKQAFFANFLSWSQVDDKLVKPGIEVEQHSFCSVEKSKEPGWLVYREFKIDEIDLSRTRRPYSQYHATIIASAKIFCSSRWQRPWFHSIHSGPSTNSSTYCEFIILQELYQNYVYWGVTHHVRTQVEHVLHLWSIVYDRIPERAWGLSLQQLFNVKFFLLEGYGRRQGAIWGIANHFHFNALLTSSK